VPDPLCGQAKENELLNASVLLAAMQDQEGKDLGVAGSMQQLSSKQLSTQPINAFSWSPDKQGLFVCSSFDQCIRVGFVTKLNKV
jgi:hypothetical protein